MSLVALFTATIVCIVANASFAVADYLKAGFVVKNSAAVHVPIGALPYLGTMKLAGALGLIVGLIALPWLGVAAGVGLTLFFVGAVIVHIKTRVLSNVAFPGAFLLLAIASTSYLLQLTHSA